MSQAVTSAVESLPIGTQPAPETSWGSGEVIYREFGAARPLPLANSTNLDNVVARFESLPGMRENLARARRELSTSLYSDERETLSALRLAAGLSQAQLAAAAFTSQPHIARIERGQTDPGTDVIARVARALGIAETRAYLAIRRQLESRGQMK